MTPLRPWEKEEYKVLHGVPNESYVSWQSFESHRDMAMYNGAMSMVQKYEKHIPRFTFENFSVGRQKVEVARNQLAVHALQKQADFILMTDNDMIYPVELFDLLIRHHADIVAPLAFTRNPPHLPVAYTYRSAWDPITKQESFQAVQPGHLPENALVRCDAVGFGAVLIRTEVLKALPQPWFFNSTGSGEDIYFCLTAAKHGFHTYMDTSIKTTHLGAQHLITEAVAKAHWQALELPKKTASTADKHQEVYPQADAHHPPEPVRI